MHKKQLATGAAIVALVLTAGGMSAKSGPPTPPEGWDLRVHLPTEHPVHEIEERWGRIYVTPELIEWEMEWDHDNLLLEIETDCPYETFWWFTGDEGLMTMNEDPGCKITDVRLDYRYNAIFFPLIAGGN